MARLFHDRGAHRAGRRRGGPGSGRTGSTAATPVLFDSSGKRWRRILAGLVLVLLLLAGSLAWVVPQALAPTSTQAKNQDAGYAQELLAGGDEENIPVLGDEDGYAFSRIGLIQEVDGRKVLADPFSDDR